jgi:hypothetical protein
MSVGRMTMLQIMLGMAQTPIRRVGNRIAMTPDAAPTIPAMRVVSRRRERIAAIPAIPSGTAAPIAAMPAQWHFIGTVLPSASVSALPAD